MSDNDLPSPRRLNPFAFPSETNVRFTLLVVTLILSSLITSAFLIEQIGWDTTPKQAERFAVSEMAEQESLLEMDADASLITETLQRYNADYAGRNVRHLVEAVRNVLPSIGMLGLTFLIAFVVYLLHPVLIRRRNQLRPLTRTLDASLLDSIQEICDQVGVALPALAIGGSRADGQAFGFKRRPTLRLGKPMGLLLRKSPSIFRAVIHHELGHLANQDVQRTYLSRGFWFAMLLAVFAPLCVTFLLRDGRALLSGRSIALYVIFTQMATILQVAGTLLVLEAMRRGMLRTREMYADYRALLWGSRTALSEIFQRTMDSGSMPSNKVSWRFHPDPAERLAVLNNPVGLFRVGRSIPFFVGFLISQMMSGVSTAQLYGYPVVDTFSAALTYALFAYVGPSGWGGFVLTVIGILITLGLFLVIIVGPVAWIAYVITRSIGLQLQRESAAQLFSLPTPAIRQGALFFYTILLVLGMLLGQMLSPLGSFSIALLPNPGASLLARAQGLALIPVWAITGIGLIWLWMVYVKFWATRILKAEIGVAQSQFRQWVMSIATTIMLVTLLSPLLLFGDLIGSVYAGQSGAEVFIQLVIITAVLFVLAILLYAALFVGTWVSFGISSRVRPPRCPTCGQIPLQHPAALANCSHCGGQLAPWLFAAP